MSAPTTDLTVVPAPSISTGSPELDDVLETLHYRLVVASEPATGLVAIAHLLASVPDWLDELTEAEPPLRWARQRVVNDQWRTAAGALETAGERMFNQLEMFTS